MPYTMEDFRREYLEDGFEEMTPEQKLKLFEKLPPQAQQKLVENLPPQVKQTLLENLSPQVKQTLLENLSPQVKQELLENLVGNLSVQERLKGLSPEEIESYLQHAKKGQASPKRRKKK
jgi:Mg/Co/Ni transporter MgtE